MNESKWFGDLLRQYRVSLAGERSRQEWLAKQLDYSKVVISKWETGDPSATLPSYEVILRIGRLYSLNGYEVNTLLESARIGTKSFVKAAQYILLSD